MNLKKTNFRNKSHGFSLIELMVVVAILSVAAAILVPRFLTERLRKKQEECRLNLTSLLSAERAYFNHNHGFATDLGLLNWKPVGRGLYQYQFLPLPASKNGFLFECSGNIDRDVTLDRAQIDETGQITQVVDDLKQ